MLIPTKLRNSVCVRQNIETNLKSLTRMERKELWGALYKLSKTSLFYVGNVLQHHKRFKINDEIVIYGEIIKSSFVAVVKIIKQELFLLSVICKKRLFNSTSTFGCVLVDDKYEAKSYSLHVFSGVDAQKNIVWTWKETYDLFSDRNFSAGEIVNLMAGNHPVTVAT